MQNKAVFGDICAARVCPLAHPRLNLLDPLSPERPAKSLNDQPDPDPFGAFRKAVDSMSCSQSRLEALKRVVSCAARVLLH